MKKFTFHANGINFGIYEANDIKTAQEIFANDAGYTSWASMCAQAAECYGGNEVEVKEYFENASGF